ncbi:helix-turn-helix domain-containing protein [Magnetospirillum aberrantis]|uniref:Helix-turn-helix domain-containing protein n=1 Tax=Magnetospirillum aberrantis SpK TaxID=908842 RepID=A0A7C9V0G6_9PROT|nr:helix-turn-helix domain-containing protein [Magnetospirillum aberrantis]NFV81293.1 helix-turn-helix domain-containing protein [Magnetospirillum aberrantis SpK]
MTTPVRRLNSQLAAASIPLRLEKYPRSRVWSLTSEATGDVEAVFAATTPGKAVARARAWLRLNNYRVPDQSGTQGSADDLLTQDEVAEILGCTPDTVYRIRRAGKLPYIPGRPVKILRFDLNAYLASEEAQAEARAKAKTASIEDHLNPRLMGKVLAAGKKGAQDPYSLGRTLALRARATGKGPW